MSLSGFKPIIGIDPKCMILGSMPSVTSLAKQEYYGYRHNRFWSILAEYYQLTLADYTAKQNCIKNNHLILWDVIASCDREGSLDAAIRNVVCNDIVALADQYPSLHLILCNGKKSYELYQRYIQPQLALECVCLPSTSNANRTISNQELYQKWFEQLSRIEKG